MSCVSCGGSSVAWLSLSLFERSSTRIRKFASMIRRSCTCRSRRHLVSFARASLLRRLTQLVREECRDRDATKHCSRTKRPTRILKSVRYDSRKKSARKCKLCKNVPSFSFSLSLSLYEEDSLSVKAFLYRVPMLKKTLP